MKKIRCTARNIMLLWSSLETNKKVKYFVNAAKGLLKTNAEIYDVEDETCANINDYEYNEQNEGVILYKKIGCYMYRAKFSIIYRKKFYKYGLGKGNTLEVINPVVYLELRRARYTPDEKVYDRVKSSSDCEFFCSAAVNDAIGCIRVEELDPNPLDVDDVYFRSCLDFVAAKKKLSKRASETLRLVNKFDKLNIQNRYVFNNDVCTRSVTILNETYSAYIKCYISRDRKYFSGCNRSYNVYNVPVVEFVYEDVNGKAEVETYRLEKMGTVSYIYEKRFGYADRPYMNKLIFTEVNRV